MSEAFTSATPPASGKSCPTCGAAIPPEAPQGLCPKCLLKQASFPTETGPTTRHTRPAPPDRDELARAFPHLQILELIGQGGMGFVYKARQPKLDRLVALKILAQPLAEQTHFAERFTREGRTLAKLNHPNIVTIHDFGQAGPFFYLLMEYVDGVNLRQAMRAGAVNSTQALAIVPRICEALQYAHNEGVLHRDIKPDNILLDTRGRVKIADFGIAKLMAEAVAENPLTGSGASLGTPHYMAPEQIEKPNAVDHRADIYSLGVVFYEMLTGELPLGRFAAPSEKSAIDPRLDDVVFQTLEKQPERRPQSADEVKTKVETIAASPQQTSTSQAQVTFKMARCYLTTPQFLSSAIGRLLRFTGKGELRLDEETLTFAPRHQNWIVIPLRAISSLSLGDFPAGIGKLKFISVTFTEKGNTHRYFFIPTRGGFRSIWNTNELVQEWFNAIRHAAKARTGCVPPSFKDDIDPLPATPTSRAALGSAILKGALTVLFLFIFALAIALGLYISLRHKSQPTPATLTTQPPASAAAKANKRMMDVIAVDASPNSHSIILHTSSDAAVGEDYVPIIRYNSGPWSQSDATSKNLEWMTDKSGYHHRGMYQWRLPSGFNSEFDMAAVTSRARAETERGPIAISTEATEIFSITNQASQIVSGGLRLVVSPLPQQTGRTVAILKDVSAYPDSNRNGAPAVQCRAEIPAGYRLIARGRAGEEVLYARSFISGGWQRFEWSVPPSVSISQGQRFMHVDLVEVTPGQPTELFSLPSGGDYFRAFLELLPMQGTISPLDATNFDSSTLSPSSTRPNSANATPLKMQATNENADDILLSFYSGNVTNINSPPRNPCQFTLTANATLSADDSLFGQLDLIRPPSKGPMELSDQARVTVESRDDSTNDTVASIWNLPNYFSVSHDIEPAIKAFFGGSSNRTFRMKRGDRLDVISITNGIGEIAKCAIRYSTKKSAIKSSAAPAIVLNASTLQTKGSIMVDLAAEVPPRSRIVATGVADGKPMRTVVRRHSDLVPFGYPSQTSISVECEWLYPEGFRAPDIQPDPSRSPMGNGMYSFNPKLHPDYLEPFSKLIRAGDARLTDQKPLEVFALTNRDGKIVRGFLHIKPAAQSDLHQSE